MNTTPPTKRQLVDYLGKYLFNQHVVEMREEYPDISWKDISLNICRTYGMKPIEDDFDVQDKLPKKLSTYGKERLLLMYYQIPAQERKHLNGKPKVLWKVHLGFDVFNNISHPDHTTLATNPKQAMINVLSRYTDDPGTLYRMFYEMRMLDKDDPTVTVEKVTGNPDSHSARRKQAIKDFQVELFA